MNNTETAKPFVVGDRVFNTGNKKRRTIGIVTEVIDADTCKILWSDGEGYAHFGTCNRDGTVNYGVDATDHEAHRIVRVKLSVRLPQEV
jgi:hypothetical protein